MKRTIHSLLVIINILPYLTVANAALVINTAGSTSVITFDSAVSGVNNGQFGGAGFSPSPTGGQLDSTAWTTSGWAEGSVAIGGTATTGSFARGTTTSSVTDPGVYSFGTSDRQLLLQPGINPAYEGESITLRIQNNTGSTLTEWTLGYQAFLRNDQSSESWLVVDLSTNGTTWYVVPHNFGVFANNSFGTNSNGWQSVQAHSHMFNSSFLAVDSGEYLYMRWRTYLAGGNAGAPRDEWGIDNISVSAVPEPSAIFLLSLACGLLLVRRNRIQDVEPQR